MSKLTNHQIKAQIDGLAQSIAADVAAGRDRAAARRRQKLEDYCTELEARRAAGQAPGTLELQEVRFGG